MSKIWGSLGGIELIKWFEFEQRDVTRPMRVLLIVDRMAHHNHLIDWLLSSFIFCKINGDKKSQEL